uniref:F-box domain-containing protein n=1 Tax=viral metagenome TaxID=1070528 RepID=A0A6C0CAK4_9ZZZZ
MEYIRYNDIFGEIKQWLRPIDLYNFVQTCKVYQKIITMKDIKISTICEIDRRLYAIFGTDFDEFKIVSKNSKVIVGGSFMIQCVLGEKWDDDIYVHVHFNELNHLFSGVTGKYLFQEENYKFGDVNDMKIIEYIFSKFSHDYIIVYIFDDQVNQVVLNIYGTRIVFGYIDFFNYIKEWVYDVGRNTYQLGGSFQYVSFHRINEIFTKRTNFFPDCVLHRKYRARGFTFYDAYNNIVSDRDIWKKMNIDIIKIKPYDNKSPEKRLQILGGQSGGYVHKGNIIAASLIPEENLYIANRCPKRNGYLYSCFYGSDTDCLFKEIYPGVEHLHYFIDHHQTLFVIDTCSEVNNSIELS